MKASELIAELAEMISEHGDCETFFEVYDRNGNNDKYKVTGIFPKEMADETMKFEIISCLDF